MTWLTNWNYRKTITVSNSGSILSDYQVLITVDTVSLIPTKMRTDCGDIRFTSSDGSTLLNYWTESGCNSSSTKIWIKIPSIPTGSNTIYLYYGNATPPNDGYGSNGTNVFIFFDDFLGTTLDAQWVETGTVVKSVTNSKLTIEGSGTDSDGAIYVNSSYLYPIAMRTKAIIKGQKAISNTGNFIGFMDVFGGSNDNEVVIWGRTGYYELRTTTYPTGGWLYGWVTNDLAVDTSEHIWDLIWTSAKAELYVDGGHYISRTAYTPSIQLKPTLYHQNYGGQKIIDWILIRKYTATEPTYTTFAEQTGQSYTYRLPIVIDNTTNSSTLTNYQVSITVDTYDINKFHNSAADIRFTSDTSSYNEQLWSVSYPYWIESGAGTATTKIWIKIDSIPASLTKTIYMYYGNPTATSASNGTNTFIAWHGVATVDFFDSLIVPSNTFIFEARARRISGTTGGDAAYWGVKKGTQGASDSLWIDSPEGNPRFISINNTSATAHTFGGAYLANGVWRRLKIISTSSTSVTAYIDSYSDTITTNLPDENMGLFMHWGGTYVGEQEWSFVRKYTSPEPTLSTPVGATGMTITPSETPCRIGICTTAVNVTWTSSGTLAFTFVPSIKIDGIPIIPDPQLNPTTVGPSRIVTQSFTVLGLTVGTHSICPDPN